MKVSIAFFIGLVLLGSNGCHAQNANQIKIAWNSTEVRATVEGYLAKTAEILKAWKNCHSHICGDKLFAMQDKALDQLCTKKSLETDCALVILLGYYEGESVGEDIYAEVVNRGKHMRPILLYAQKNIQETLPKFRHEGVQILGAKATQSEISEAISDIDSGEKLKF